MHIHKFLFAFATICDFGFISWSNADRLRKTQRHKLFEQGNLRDAESDEIRQDIFEPNFAQLNRNWAAEKEAFNFEEEKSNKNIDLDEDEARVYDKRFYEHNKHRKPSLFGKRGRPQRPEFECGSTPISPDLRSTKIVNGSEAVPNSWPWVVAMEVKMGDNPYRQSCGAAVLSEEFVITAAHCMFNRGEALDINIIRLVIGAHDLSTIDDATIRTISKIYVKPDYDPAVAWSPNDVAILKLNKPVQFDDNIQPICLAAKDVTKSSNCYTVGWGDTMSTGSDNVLNQLAVPIIDQKLCEKWMTPYVTNAVICAGYEEGMRDSCRGDSGGPLMCQGKDGLWSLYGVTSWGMLCASAFHPGLYTRLNLYLDWIVKITEIEPRNTEV